ncbi:MAG TPA: DUF4124 domain-containing protein [Gallionella sp.]
MKTFLLIFLIFPTNNVHAALNKWIDSNGQIHYSDVPPPPEVQGTKLRGTTSAEPSSPQNESDAASAEPKSLAEREAELKKARQDKKAAEEKAAKDQAYADSLKASCAGARQNLMVLKDGRRIAELDASGETVYMEDDQRQERIRKTEQDIEKYCK